MVKLFACFAGTMEIVIRYGPNDLMTRVFGGHVKPSTAVNRSRSQLQTYLEDSNNLHVISYQAGRRMCTILVRPQRLEYLEELWEEYEAGNLAAIIQSTLAESTDDGEFQVEIDEDQYMTCASLLKRKGQNWMGAWMKERGKDRRKKRRKEERQKESTYKRANRWIDRSMNGWVCWMSECLTAQNQ